MVVPHALGGDSEVIYFEKLFDMDNHAIDLTPVLLGNKDGARWLLDHQKYFMERNGTMVPMVFSSALWKPSSFCFLTDGGISYARDGKVVGDFAGPPRGAVHIEIDPPNKHYSGVGGVISLLDPFAVDSQQTRFSYKLVGTRDRQPLPGILLGNVVAGDFRCESRASTPIKHLAEVTYGVDIIDLAQGYRPRTIRFDVVE